MRDCTEMVIQAQAGDREALARLIAAVRDDIWHLLLSRLRNPADAEDATQETFVQAIVSLPDLRDPRAFPGWLYRIALDKARRVRRDAPAAAASEPFVTSEAEGMEREETRAAVRKAVQGLEERLRTTVELRYEHGLAYADIARAMDCPEGTVADRLHTAHDRLKRLLAGAGVAVTMAIMERELSAAPRSAAPAGLASKLDSLARRPRQGTSAIARGPAVKGAIAAAAMLALAIWLARMGRGAISDDGGSEPATRATGAVGGQGGALEAGPGGGAGPVRSTSDPAQDSAGIPATALAIVEGRVRDARSGDAVDGARVWLEPESETDAPGPSTRSDASGAFRMEAREGAYLLRVYADGYLESSVEREIRDALSDDPRNGDGRGEGVAVRLAAGRHLVRDVDLVAGIRITGRVVDEQGGSIPDAQVDFVAQQVPGEDGGFPRTVSYLPDGDRATFGTDLQGRFVLPGIYPRGQADLRVTRAGFEPVSHLVALSGSDVDVTIELRRGVDVAGEVVDHLGLPIAGARVFIGGTETGSGAFLVEKSSRSDADGRFSLQSCPRSTTCAAAWAPGHGWAIASIASSGSGRLKLVLPAASGTLRGCVKDRQGQPIGGVRVRVACLDLRHEGVAWRLGFGDSVVWPSDRQSGAAALVSEEIQAGTCESREDGTWEISGVPVGSGTPVGLEFTRDSFEQQQRLVDADSWLDVVLEKSK